MSRGPFPREKRLIKIGRMELLHRRDSDEPLTETFLVIRWHRRRHLHLVR